MPLPIRDRPERNPPRSPTCFLEVRTVIRLPRRTDPVLAAFLALAFLLTCALSAQAADAKGRVKSVTTDKMELVMADDTGKNWTIIAARDCKVRLNDRDSKFEDLQTDDEITVTYEKDGDKLVARTIRATRR
jgi:hypothetical protein